MVFAVGTDSDENVEDLWIKMSRLSKARDISLAQFGHMTSMYTATKRLSFANNLWKSSLFWNDQFMRTFKRHCN